MATLLESYIGCKNTFDTSMQTAMPGPILVWCQQEITYRIGVLETCQMFVKTAPKSADTRDLHWHYQMVDAYMQNLTLERRYGCSVDENAQKRRDTAHGNLLRVIQDYRKRFGSFSPGSDVECYRKTIGSVIQTVLPVWIQYRETYIEIKKETV